MYALHVEFAGTIVEIDAVLLLFDIGEQKAQ